MRITNSVLDWMLKVEIAAREGRDFCHKKFTRELSELVTIATKESH